MKRKVIALTVTAGLGGLGLFGCHGGGEAANRVQVANLDQALRPAVFASALRKLGGAHFHGTTRMAVTAGSAAGGAAARPGEAGASADAVTTTTDAWLDRTGNYRIVENNDRDGGREIVVRGRDLYVALRYGKMIRRAAEEPEPEQLLQQALGGPWAAWEIAAPFAAIERGGTELLGGAKASQYRVTKSDRRAEAPQDLAVGVRKWRGTVAVQKLDGRLWIDDSSGALIKSELAISFTGQRDDRPLQGTIEVRTDVDGAASTAPIAKPAAAEELALRQRIVPEQKELLSGLRGTPVAPAAAAPRPTGGRAPAAGTKGKHP